LISQLTIAKRLTAAYVAGLTLIAVLSGTVHVLLDRVIVQQRDAGTVINVAGRQRMLSQRIALLASDVHAGDTKARQPLVDATALMERSENALVRGGDLGIVQPLSPAAQRYYFEGLAPLDPAVRAFLGAAHRFVAPVNGDDAEDAYRAMATDARTFLLPALDRAVSIFEGEANSRIDWLRTAQTVLLAVLLITLVLEALLIFRPLVLKVKRYSADLYELATRDGLTGLTNRRHFMESAARDFLLARRSPRRLSALILDIDHFKQINDTHGHAVGDKVLRHFAAIATGTLRRSDVLGRIGGEEFALVLNEIELSAAMTVAEKLRQTIADDRTEGLPAFTISVGVGLLERDDKDIDDVFRRADLALYTAKRGGRNRVAFEPAGEQDPIFVAEPASP
jgi:diguanylate cyclase (GGDEF)-like protein